jgi:predicted dienelactone hydrolase
MKRRYGALLALALCGAAPLANAAGLRFIEVPADDAGPALTGAVWSPCAAPVGELQLGSAVLPAVKDCPIAGEKLPLVVISHGRGGSFIGHHDTAETLADAGFVVAAINHPGDTTEDASRTGDLSVYLERPADMKRLVDYMLGAWPHAATIDPARIGLFGFSRGGYTGLVAIGANPDFRQGLAFCPEGSARRICEQIRNNEIPDEPGTHDPRIKAAVIADPAAALFFAAGGLGAVRVPVQLWGSANGGDGVLPEQVAAVAQGLPAKPAIHVVANAGHFAFLAPCWPEMARAVPRLCIDEPGFDRAAFHRTFNADALAFFQEHLAAEAR